MHLNCRELPWDCWQKQLILSEAGQNRGVKVWPEGKQEGWNPDPSWKPGHLLDLLSALLSRKQFCGSCPTWYGALWPWSRWADDRPSAIPLVCPRHFLGKANEVWLHVVGCRNCCNISLACLPSHHTVQQLHCILMLLGCKAQGQDFLV